jgi:hypothetical protein
MLSQSVVACKGLTHRMLGIERLFRRVFPLHVDEGKNKDERNLRVLCERCRIGAHRNEGDLLVRFLSPGIFREIGRVSCFRRRLSFDSISVNRTPSLRRLMREYFLP